MKITKDNIDVVPKKEQVVLLALLDDLEFINNNSTNKLFINWIEFHTEYSPEWTEPCPDFYGMYELRLEDDPRESIGIEMTLNELDMAMCTLYNYVEYEKVES